MLGIATPLRFGRAHIREVLTHNGLGEFVGIRAIVEDGLTSHGQDVREWAGWMITGTLGYAMTDRDGWPHTTGIWLPPEVIGE